MRASSPIVVYMVSGPLLARLRSSLTETGLALQELGASLGATSPHGAALTQCGTQLAALPLPGLELRASQAAELSSWLEEASRRPGWLEAPDTHADAWRMIRGALAREGVPEATLENTEARTAHVQELFDLSSIVPVLTQAELQAATLLAAFLLMPPPPPPLPPPPPPLPPPPPPGGAPAQGATVDAPAVPPSPPSPPAPARPVLPHSFRCCITRELMRDPVMNALGFTYEREAIEEWYKRKDTDPKSGVRVPHTGLTTNWTVREAIEDWLTGNGLTLKTYADSDDVQQPGGDPGQGPAAAASALNRSPAGPAAGRPQGPVTPSTSSGGGRGTSADGGDAGGGDAGGSGAGGGRGSAPDGSGARGSDAGGGSRSGGGITPEVYAAFARTRWYHINEIDVEAKLFLSQAGVRPGIAYAMTLAHGQPFSMADLRCGHVPAEDLASALGLSPHDRTVLVSALAAARQQSVTSSGGGGGSSSGGGGGSSSSSGGGGSSSSNGGGGASSSSGGGGASSSSGGGDASSGGSGDGASSGGSGGGVCSSGGGGGASSGGGGASSGGGGASSGGGGASSGGGGSGQENAGGGGQSTRPSGGGGSAAAGGNADGNRSGGSTDQADAA
ncbi:hypothetical protein HYH03_016240 [Edaphochlamys debaryana]|uniref:U-box domain-containing protein n=1 Tax=Edaphochlamys debaryana TaxID=47281 RepID=A0A836BQH8_9CHLO|nr:hypothetical protein HYH03_016240 [Edaphochlamys debaryana]|eukprot:KAG2485037.1 hypothetical protein HYH03_016240 [Edaphochlamys debaryana]